MATPRKKTPRKKARKKKGPHPPIEHPIKPTPITWVSDIGQTRNVIQDTLNRADPDDRAGHVPLKHSLSRPDQQRWRKWVGRTPEGYDRPTESYQRPTIGPHTPPVTMSAKTVTQVRRPREVFGVNLGIEPMVLVRKGLTELWWLPGRQIGGQYHQPELRLVNLDNHTLVSRTLQTGGSLTQHTLSLRNRLLSDSFGVEDLGLSLDPTKTTVIT